MQLPAGMETNKPIVGIDSEHQQVELIPAVCGGISTLLLFAHLISGLSGIQRQSAAFHKNVRPLKTEPTSLGTSETENRVRFQQIRGVYAGFT